MQQATKASSPPLRIVVVEDSTFFRRQLIRLLEETSGFEVVGEAANGREAVVLAAQLRPDLITMDVEMPVMDGIDAVREIMRSTPTRIVMLSSFTHAGANATLGALDAGAIDFITKRRLGGGPARDGGSQLFAQLRAVASGPRVPGRSPSAIQSQQGTKPTPSEAVAAPQPTGRIDCGLLVLGASTGGPALFGDLLAAVPAGFPAPILLVVHMPQAFTTCFAERLSRRCRLPVHEAVDGMPVRAGQVLLAPGGMQTRLQRRNGVLVTEVFPGAADALYKPSIDLVLDSVATEVGPQALAVILTGMGNDGTRGAAGLVKAGGTVWAQDQASSTVFGMPAAVIRAGLTSKVVSATELAVLLDGSH